jgi:hypothetical protein
MVGGVFLIQNDGSLVEMEETPYDSESLLQELLAKYPNLLAGSQIDENDPRRWLLIGREATLPSEEGGSDRWSVDHLFLDQDAIPTLVEVKKSSNTDIRRKVVGQMLDYAANAVVYWPVEELRSKFESTCKDLGMDASEKLAEFVEGNQDEFWTKVKNNLQIGRIRLLFVADDIPQELRRVVEYLNGQMKETEVLALEVKQHLGQGQKVFVPRVIGRVEKPDGGGEVKEWDEASFLQSLGEKCGEAEVEVAKKILEEAQKRGLEIKWGRGKTSGAFYPMVEHNGLRYYTIWVWDYGNIAVEFMYIKKRPPFDVEEKRVELRNLLNSIPGIMIPVDKIGGEPNFRLAALKDKVAFEKFFDVIDWMIQTYKAN